MDNGLYNHYAKMSLNQANDFRMKSLFNLIKKYLDINKLTLDAGCGSNAQLVPLLKEHYFIEGIEQSEEMYNIGKIYLQENGFYGNPVKRISISDHATNHTEHYEQIICLDVIEHIHDDLTAIRDLYRMLQKGGKLLLTVPAIPYLFGKKDASIGHYRRYSKTELTSKIEEAGFNIKETRYWNFIGVAPTYISVKLLKSGVSESFRQNNDIKSKLINSILNVWFNVLENNIKMPIGLTLFVYAEKR